jgi:UDP-N-acetylglucosamine 1-carboxyvinyltransferase
VLHNVPSVSDVDTTLDILSVSGCTVTRLSPTSVEINGAGFRPECSPAEPVGSIRASSYLMGVELGRFHRTKIAFPGGCKFGVSRPLDYHTHAFEIMGAEMDPPGGEGFRGEAPDGLHGAKIILDQASVGATVNIMLAAVLTPGTTIIGNAAREPHIVDLANFLNMCGGYVKGAGTSEIRIEGVAKLHGCSYTIVPDMIEVGSFIGMAAMTRSELTIRNVSLENLGVIPDSFRRLGILIEERGDNLYIPRQEHYQIESFIDGSIMTIADAPWPGLTPDLLSVLLVTAIQAKGSVLIHQKMFESRLFFVDKLIEMGAQIILCDPHRAVVNGHDHAISLRGRTMTSPDIRAGIALLIAAMSAEGTSRIDRIDQIDRGYQNIDERLNRLGARITRIEL